RRSFHHSVTTQPPGFPAKAGIHPSSGGTVAPWVPAFAGTPGEGIRANTSVSRLVAYDRRVGVADQRLVGCARPGVELGQQRIIERARFALRHRAVRVVLVAEQDCLGRAALLAGGDDLAIMEV